MKTKYRRLRKSSKLIQKQQWLAGADVELPTPQKLEWGAATAVGIAEAIQFGLSWSRGRTRYLGDILATAATVTNEFCLGETQRTNNVFLKVYIHFIRNLIQNYCCSWEVFLLSYSKPPDHWISVATGPLKSLRLSSALEC